MWLTKRNVKEDSDTELLQDYISTGNLTSIEVLYSKYIHMVYGVCIKYLSRRDDSQDAVMDIFEQLTVKLKEHEIKQFRAWLYVYTKNYCLMKIRQDDRKKMVDADSLKDSFVEELVDAVYYFDIDKLQELRKDELKVCIEKLADKQKQSIQLFYFSGKCYREIATRLGVEHKTVKSHIQNARKNLKKCLEVADE